MSVQPLTAIQSRCRPDEALFTPSGEVDVADDVTLLRVLLERRCGALRAAEAADVLLAAFEGVGAVLAADARAIRRHVALPEAAVLTCICCARWRSDRPGSKRGDASC